MTIQVYVTVDENDQEGDREYSDYNEAKKVAEPLGWALIMRTYEYSDHELIWTPNGEDTWPPK